MRRLPARVVLSFALTSVLLLPSATRVRPESFVPLHPPRASGGDGPRTAKPVGTATTTYLWDRQSGLPLLIDDGTNGYVQADGVLVQVGTGGASYPLADALGSIRGAVDSGGSLSASADYDVFGTVRAGTDTGAFGFASEQTDAETGLSFLRARSYDPASGRFLPADTVQPNAPGTQGYNSYGWVRNA